MLTPEFYRRFENFRYILIYQLDAWVFRDELDRWVSEGYDYIGAPWIPMKERFFHFYGKLRLAYNRTFRKNDGIKPHNTFLYGVGNGGFSLRKTDKFIEITTRYKDKISSDLSSNEKLYPEDLWFFYGPKGKDRLLKPHWKKALEFSFEQNPDKSFEFNGGRLPFGCHAWYPNRIKIKRTWIYQ